MTPETIDSIKEAMAPVADKIGQTAEYGWEILVWGQFAEGVAMLLIGLVGIGVSFFVLRWGKNRYTEDEYDFGASMALFFGSFGACIFAAIIYIGLISVIAPEYAALKFLIGSVK